MPAIMDGASPRTMDNLGTGAAGDSNTMDYLQPTPGFNITSVPKKGKLKF